MRNQITLIGKMADSAQVTNFENGAKVARFSLFIPDLIKGNKSSERHRLFCFGNLAHFIENFGGKGKKIAVTGKLVTRTYLNDVGITRKITEVEVRHVIGL